MSATTTYLYGLIHIIQGRFAAQKERGATAVEYGLMVGLIAAVIITVVATLGTKIAALFTTITAGI
jgi:pilus assembly protein Flp/PilA